MPRILFEDLIVSGRKGGRARSLRALPFSLTVHALAAAAVAFVAARPAASELSERPPGILVLPTNPTPTPAQQDVPRVATAGPQPTRSGSGGPPAPIPVEEPTGVQPEQASDAPTPVCLTHCGDGTGAPGDGPADGATGPALYDGAGDDIGPRQVGAGIRPPLKLHDVLPIYPELARRTGVQGSVTVQCVIDEAGHVVEARVLKGHLLLDEAALEAVRQWTYQPTRLNGKPIAVIMTVTVNFVLRR